MSSKSRKLNVRKYFPRKSVLLEKNINSDEISSLYRLTTDASESYYKFLII